ncbi:MAG: RloB family protein [Oscillospiraceae bacterium]|nr:RloB family protein [Oscillospiraceae bacterium]
MGRVKEYNRTNKANRTKNIYLIVCEGINKTEKLYFNNFKKRTNEFILKIENSEATDPKSMLETTKYFMKKYDVDVSEGDRAFCVLDFDANLDKIKLIEELSKEYTNINIIPSNPCFEVWYMLHFKESIGISTSKNIERELKKYINNYEKSKDVYKFIPELQGNILLACQRAENINKKYIQNSISKYSDRANPYTEIQEIVKVLIKLI